jgi:hypothetical protein
LLAGHRSNPPAPSTNNSRATSLEYETLVSSASIAIALAKLLQTGEVKTGSWHFSLGSEQGSPMARG